MSRYKDIKNRLSGMANEKSLYSTEEVAFTYECTKLKGTGKEGVLKPDSDGCYTLIIGALNARNSQGDYYALEGARKLFDESSTFQRKIKKGVLKCELDHPQQGAMSDEAFLDRCLKTLEMSTCGTWRKIELGSPMRTAEGETVIPIIGTIFPSGALGHVLVKEFEAKGQNVCFSIRSFADRYKRPDGTYTKVIKEIITFDKVAEPGMTVAEKFSSPQMECFYEKRVIDKTVKSYMENGKRLSLSFEENQQLSSALKERFSLIQKRSNVSPSFARW